MTLHTKYRPLTFEEVIGHADVTASLQGAVAEGTSHAFLFTGPAGTGKTTLARLTAAACGVQENGITEVDAATRTGVEDMRQLAELANSYSFTENGWRAIILDECHMLTRNAWNAALKVLEEPPPHLFWFLCTTEVGKVIPTVKSRCLTYELRPLPRAQIHELLDRVTTAEGFEVSADVKALVAEEANGSPRTALTLLGKVHNAPDVSTARSLMCREAPSYEAYDVAKAIFSGADFEKVRHMLASMLEVSPESARITIFAYAQSVLLRGDKAKVTLALKVMGQLEHPIPETNRVGGLALRLARALYGK